MFDNNVLNIPRLMTGASCSLSPQVKEVFGQLSRMRSLMVASHA